MAFGFFYSLSLKNNAAMNNLWHVSQYTQAHIFWIYIRRSEIVTLLYFCRCSSLMGSVKNSVPVCTQQEGMRVLVFPHL